MGNNFYNRLQPAFGVNFSDSPAMLAERDRLRREQEQNQATGLVMQALQPTARSMTMPGNLQPQFSNLQPGDLVRPPSEQTGPLLYPEQRSYTSKPTLSEALQSVMQNTASPGVNREALRMIHGFGLQEQPEEPVDIKKERRLRAGTMARQPGATAEQVQLAEDEGIKGLTFDPNYAKERAFEAEVAAGKHGDPSTAQGLLQAATDAQAIGLPKKADEYQKRATLVKAGREERTDAAYRAESVDTLKATDMVLQNFGDKMPETTSAAVRTAMANLRASPSAKTYDDLTRSLEKAQSDLRLTAKDQAKADKDLAGEKAKDLGLAVREDLRKSGIDPRSATGQQITDAAERVKKERAQGSIESARAKVEMNQAEKSLSVIQTNRNQLDAAETLANRQERLSKELSDLMMGADATSLQKPIQWWAKHFTSGKIAAKLAEFETLNGEYAKVAMGVEGLTGVGRMAVANTNRALSFHAKAEEPLAAKNARIGALREVIASTRARLNEEEKLAQERLEKHAPIARGGGLIDLGDAPQ